MSGNAEYRGMVWQIAEDYACADLLLRLPGHCPMPVRSRPSSPTEACTRGPTWPTCNGPRRPVTSARRLRGMSSHTRHSEPITSGRQVQNIPSSNASCVCQTLSCQRWAAVRELHPVCALDSVVSGAGSSV